VVVVAQIDRRQRRVERRSLDAEVLPPSNRDPWTFGGEARILVAAAALGCYLPARRTSRLDPVAVLRD
jgi:ABC-type lipoprotein release transport system permease subunit